MFSKIIRKVVKETIRTVDCVYDEGKKELKASTIGQDIKKGLSKMMEEEETK